ncbi:hypothetical protein [Candidatus Odyssella thessalonicensis]|uniref:hypothetical protein n=1 Tax=Candidatus Odyssella thessalonicensis TaxID=84647 RepID=UPI0011129EC2|nr:hypothetical protein [Candidatus Odyssella thessalonicensis]
MSLFLTHPLIKRPLFENVKISHTDHKVPGMNGKILHSALHRRMIFGWITATEEGEEIGGY